NIWIVATAQKNKLTVGAVGAIVKSVASDTGVKGRFTTHSIRIGSAIAAIEAGLSLMQIWTIE
ncbi:18460_t:CDS:1, partial [Gigaspora margarita]